jgi:hypothetical protein
MTFAKLFVYALLLLQSGAAISYGVQGNLRMALYWAFAVGITVVVTF